MDHLPEGRLPEGWPLMNFVTVPGMVTADGADHRRLRGLVTQAFTPRRTAELAPAIEARATALLDGVALLEGRLRPARALRLPAADAGDRRAAGPAAEAAGRAARALQHPGQQLRHAGGRGGRAAGACSPCSAGWRRPSGRSRATT
ncbi:hypothetical protein [Kitasatospora albolonga]|uniref:hypothetical protein n=1 Tax=Kitasatospora albolonga TaxID=68173 RepID=UPI0031EE941E